MVIFPTVPKVGMPITADEVARLEQLVAKSIPQIDDIDMLQESHAQASALEAYLKSRDLQRPMLGAQRRIEGRIGQLFGEPEKGGRGKTSEHVQRFDDHQKQDFRVLGKGLKADILDEDEWRNSRRVCVDLIRAKLNLLPEIPPLPDGVFDVILADPPWKYNNSGLGGSAEKHYSCMGTDVICAMRERLDPKFSKNAILFLWTTNPFAPDGHRVCEAWGFDYKTSMVWIKDRPTYGKLGFFLYGHHEQLFLAVKGSKCDRNLSQVP